jgi:hypothetical protein
MFLARKNGVGCSDQFLGFNRRLILRARLFKFFRSDFFTRNAPSVHCTGYRKVLFYASNGAFRVFSFIFGFKTRLLKG